MGEFFEISILVKTKDLDIIDAVKLAIANNISFYFKNKKTILSIYDDYEDFVILMFGVENFKFSKSEYLIQVRKIQKLVDLIIQNFINVQIIVLCSYELNIYLFRNVKSWVDITLMLMAKFPLIFIRPKSKNLYDVQGLSNTAISQTEQSLAILNKDAQVIF